MNIEELRTLADLAMVELHEDEVDRLSGSITDMLEYFSLMQQIDVEGLEPTTHTLADKTTVRSDEVNTNPINPADLINRAPEHDNNHIVIPNVL